MPRSHAAGQLSIDVKKRQSVLIQDGSLRCWIRERATDNSWFSRIGLARELPRSKSITMSNLDGNKTESAAIAGRVELQSVIDTTRGWMDDNDNGSLFGAIQLAVCIGNA